MSHTLLVMYSISQILAHHYENSVHPLEMYTQGPLMLRPTEDGFQVDKTVRLFETMSSFLIYAQHLP